VVIDDGNLSVVTRATPTPGPGEALIKVKAAGLNAADLLQRRGFYPAPPGWPVDVPGMELAGEVVALGLGVTTTHIGARVCSIVGGGAQSTHCLVPAEHLLEIPQEVSWDEAGGFPEAFITAYDALITQANLRTGERVLISGAAGGVGVAAVQIARAWGATVIAVTRDDAHHEALRSLGASETITLDDVAAIEPVDVVLELVGAAHLTLALGRLAPHARVVVIGLGSGSKIELDLRLLMMTRALITGSTLRSRSSSEKALVAERVRVDLLPKWSSGTLRVVMAGHYALDDVNEAYDAFATPGKFGKIVLRTEDS